MPRAYRKRTPADPEKQAREDKTLNQLLKKYEKQELTIDDVIHGLGKEALRQYAAGIQRGDPRYILDMMGRLKPAKEVLRPTRKKNPEDMADDLRDTIASLSDRLMSRKSEQVLARDIGRDFAESGDVIESTDEEETEVNEPDNGIDPGGEVGG